MNYDLLKLHHWLLSSTFKSKWIEETFKHQILSITSWFLYCEFRKNKKFIDLVRENRFVMGILITPLLICLVFFSIGRLTANDKTIVVKRITIINRDFEGVNFDKLKDERKYIEYLAHSKYKVENYKNLQSLSDEVFFTIVSEINHNRIPPSIFFRLLDQESGFRNIKNKNSGANGIPQIMPDTRKMILDKIGKTNHKVIDDIRVASYHLKVQHDLHKRNGNDEKSSWFLSLVDYNGGSYGLAHHNMECYTTNF